MDSLIVFCAKYLIAVVALIGLIVWFQANKKAKIKLAAATISALIVAFVISKIASKLYYDPRPFVKTGIKPLFAHAPDNGFPSDHSWISMTVAAILFYYQKSWAWLAAALAVIIGISRVMAHVHSPVDIIAGFLIGIVSAVIAQEVVRRFLREKPKSGTSASS